MSSVVFLPGLSHVEMFKKGHKISQVFISRFFFFWYTVLMTCMNRALILNSALSQISSLHKLNTFSFPEMTSAISTLSEMTTARIHRKGAGNISPE